MFLISSVERREIKSTKYQQTYRKQGIDYGVKEELDALKEDDEEDSYENSSSNSALVFDSY